MPATVLSQKANKVISRVMIRMCCIHLRLKKRLVVMYVPICPMKASPVQPRFGVQLIPLSAQLEMKDSPPIVTAV